jgi:hypothetical protein
MSESCIRYSIMDAIVDPKKIRQLEKDFSWSAWKWSGIEPYTADFVEVTFSLGRVNRLEGFNFYWTNCHSHYRDVVIFATELSKALTSGYIIFEFRKSENRPISWGLKIEPNKVYLLKFNQVPQEEITEMDNFDSIKQRLGLDSEE